MWGYAIDDRPWNGSTPPAVVYLYAEDRKGEHPAAHLAEFQGMLQVDGYCRLQEPAGGPPAGPDQARLLLGALPEGLLRDPPGPPARRLAEEALRRIGELYTIEAEIRGRPAEERRAVRQERSKPLVDALHAWLTAQLGRVSGAPPWPRRSATPCATGRGWCCSSRTAGSSWTPTPSSGRSAPIALGRKNSLFAGSDGGARHWAIVASLVATAKLNGVEPLAWLTDVLERMVSGRTKAHELERLLPWTWKMARPVDT